MPPSPPSFKLSGTVTFLTIPRRWNTCSDGSAIPEHGERCSKNTRARYSSSIKSKYKFEYKYGLRSDLRAPNLKNLSGGACPQPPQTVRAYTRTIIGGPPIVSTFHHLCNDQPQSQVPCLAYHYMKHLLYEKVGLGRRLCTLKLYDCDDTIIGL